MKTQKAKAPPEKISSNRTNCLGREKKRSPLRHPVPGNQIEGVCQPIDMPKMATPLLTASIESAQVLPPPARRRVPCLFMDSQHDRSLSPSWKIHWPFPSAPSARSNSSRETPVLSVLSSVSFVSDRSVDGMTCASGAVSTDDRNRPIPSTVPLAIAARNRSSL